MLSVCERDNILNTNTLYFMIFRALCAGIKTDCTNTKRCDGIQIWPYSELQRHFNEIHWPFACSVKLLQNEFISELPIAFMKIALIFDPEIRCHSRHKTQNRLIMLVWVCVFAWIHIWSAGKLCKNGNTERIKFSSMLDGYGIIGQSQKVQHTKSNHFEIL